MQKVIINQEKCIGCGSCTAVCPSLFEMGSDGRASLKGGIDKGEKVEKEVENVACKEDAAQGCPVQCIHIEEI